MNEGQIVSFLDKQQNFSVHFFEGQKLIRDLIMTTPLNPHGFNFFREMVLSALGVTAFLKPGENAGIYIDSEEPFFRLKIEISSSGQMRTLLLPEDFSEFPEKINGEIRVSKMFSSNKASSYTSVINASGLTPQEAINRVFKESYQMESRVMVSDDSDQAIMMLKLPGIGGRNFESSMLLPEYELQNKKYFNDIFKKGHNDDKAICQEFKNLEFNFIGKRPIFFKCACSREKMVVNLRNMANSSPENLFEEGQSILQVKCDYCQSYYEISKEDLIQ